MTLVNYTGQDGSNPATATRQTHPKENTTFYINFTHISLEYFSDVVNVMGDISENEANMLVLLTATVKTVDLYMPPVILVFGLVGNVLSFLVMIRKHNRSNSTCFLMAVLSVIDLLVITGPLNIFWCNYNFLKANKSVILCKATNFTSNYLFQTSAWILLVMTVQRVVSVCDPLKTKDRVTMKCTKYWVVAVVIALLCCNIHIFWTANLIYQPATGAQLCVWSMKQFPFLVEVFVIADILIGSALPFFMILVSNIVIISTIKAAGKRRKNLHGAGKSTNEGALTTMLLSVSFTFLILVTPLRLRRTVLAYLDIHSFGLLAKAVDRTVYAICHKLIFINSAVNFYIYCIGGGQRFKSDLFEMLGCRKRGDSGQRGSSVPVSQVKTYVRPTPREGI